MQSIEHILVPVDGSSNSSHAAHFAGGIAGLLGAQITLLHVEALSAASLMGLAGQDAEEVSVKIHNVGHPIFHGAVEAMGRPEHTVEVRETVKIGDPATEIVAYARSHGVQMIVMGSRGHSPIKELLLGSVSEEVARNAHCPVTIVR